MVKLSSVKGVEGAIPWSAVVEANSERIPPEPEAVWVAALGGSPGTQNGDGQWSVNCPNPFHGGDGDSKASMRWFTAPDRGVLVHCNADCDYADIMATVGLKPHQLKAAHTNYIYLDRGRSRIGVHERREEEDGKHIYWTGRTAKPGLWLMPDLIDWVKNRPEGEAVVWLCEGEKDATLVAGALAAGWLGKTRNGAIERVAATTTTADGAGSIGVQAEEDMQYLIDAGVTWRIAVDPDAAGERRAEDLRERLLLRGAADVTTWRWDGMDAGDAVSKLREGWLDAAVVDTPSDPYHMPSEATGMLYEGDFEDGSGYGLLYKYVTQKTVRALVVMPVAPRVVGVECDDAGVVGAWHLEWADHDGVVRGIRLAVDEVSSRTRFNNLVRSPGGVIRLGAKIGVEQFAAWVEYHGRSAPRVRIAETCGWVSDSRTEFATHEGPLVGSHTARKRDEPLWCYGTEADEREAAELLIQVLMFRDANESVPVVAALAANAARPWADEFAGPVRLMQVPALSATGKTSFLRPAVRLFGSVGEGSGDETPASLSRSLAAGTGPIWLDDIEDPDGKIESLLRQAATGGGRKRADKDSLTEIVSQKSLAFTVYSAENELGAGDKAMIDRSLTVKFEVPVEGRKWALGPWKGREQYARIKELGGASSERHSPITRVAGTLTRGLIGAADVVAERLVDGSDSGNRWERLGRWVRFGAELLAEWLSGVVARAEPGWEWRRIATAVVKDLRKFSEKWAEKDTAERAERSQQKTDLYVVSEVLPRAVAAGALGVTGWKHLGADAADPKIGMDQALIGVSGGRTIPTNGVVAWVYPEIGADGKTREVTVVAAHPKTLYIWASSQPGLLAGMPRNGAAKRHIGVDAIAAQLKSASGGLKIDKTWFQGVEAGKRTQPTWWVLVDVVTR